MTTVPPSDIELLRTTLRAMEVATLELVTKAASDPAALGSLAAKGKTVADIPDLVPASFTMRTITALLRLCLANAESSSPTPTSDK